MFLFFLVYFFFHVYVCGKGVCYIFFHYKHYVLYLRYSFLSFIYIYFLYVSKRVFSDK